jgi:hypothetical protein
MRVVIDRDERLALVAHKVTLNGVPAAICGTSLDFPRVVQLKSGMGVEFSWPTVRHIIENRNGEFHA